MADANEAEGAARNEFAAGTPWAEFDTEGLRGLIPVEEGDAETAAGTVNRAFYDGDHWQEGRGWVGPTPGEEEEGRDDVMALIEAGFCSRNVVAETVDRHVDALLGREPVWGLTPRRGLEEDEEPTDAEQALIDEAEALLTDWWNERDVHDLLHRMMVTLLLEDRAAFRIYVPAGLAAEVGTQASDGGITISVADIEEALELLFPDHPLPKQSAVAVDPDTQRQLGVFIDVRESGEEVLEIAYLDELREYTVIERLTGKKDDAAAADAEPFTYQLGRRLPMIEVTRQSFVTEQVRDQQKALNLAQSTIPRTVATAGFLETVLLNAQMPGEWEEDEEGNRVRFIPANIKRGPATQQFYTGVDYTQEDPTTGKKTTVVATPSINWRPPTPVTPAVEASNAHYQAILAEVDQQHTLISGDATASGVSRQHARADFISSVRKTNIRANRVGRWLIETVLAYAEDLAGQAGHYTEQLRATFECVPDYGPISNEERLQNNADVEAGTLSQETAMSRNGVEDPDAERARIEASTDSQLAVRERQVAVAVSLVRDGAAPLLPALVFAGVDEEDETLDALEQDFENDPPAPGLPPNVPPVPGGGPQPPNVPPPNVRPPRPPPQPQPANNGA